MGAALLLIETRGVKSLSLLFGSTWLVNASIFSGILLLVLVANILVERFSLSRLTPWFALLAFGWYVLAVLFVAGQAKNTAEAK